MEESTLVIIGAVVVVALVVLAIVAAVMAASRKRKREDMRERYGPEYDRLAEDRGDNEATQELDARSERVARYDLRPIPADRRQDLLVRWRDVRSEFVDQPADAVVHADALLIEVMRIRGYEGVEAGPDRRVEDLTAVDAEGAEEYRIARAVSERARDGGASTEELREAMQHYSKVLDSMLQAAAR